MKNYFLLTILLFSFKLTYGQVAELLPEMEEQTNYSIFLSDENEIVYRFKSDYSPFYENKFKVYDTKTTVYRDFEIESIRFKGADGIVVNYFIREGLIYELLLFKGSKTDGNTYNALAIRDLETFKQIGELAFVDEIESSYIGAGQGHEIYMDDNGFSVLAGSPYVKKHFIKHFDYELTENWSLNLDFLDVSGVTLHKTSVSSKGDLLLSIFFTEEPKSSVFKFNTSTERKSGLNFLHIDSAGEASVISPEFDGALSVSNYDFKYYPERKEIVGIFSTTKSVDIKKNEISGIGYVYMVWDFDGKLIKTNKQFLTYADVNSKYLQSFINTVKIKNNSIESGKDLPAISMLDNFEVFFQNDGSLIVAHEDFKEVGTAEGGRYSSSNLVYFIDSNGELVWTNFFPQEFQINSLNSSYVQRNNKLYVYSSVPPEQAEEFSGEKNNLATLFSSFRTTLLTERVIDIETGNIISFEPVITTPLENFTYIVFYNRPDVLIFEYHYFKKNKMRLAVIDRL